MVLNLEEILDRRSGGCEVSAGSDLLAEGWELWSGSASLWEELAEGILGSSPQTETSLGLVSFSIYS